MTIEEMRERKKELGFTNQIIADRTGIPLSTVQKIFAGATASPRKETVRA
ncbi:MAG: helix-turn-helix domain-containing protein, partial [bacterium]